MAITDIFKKEEKKLLGVKKNATVANDKKLAVPVADAQAKSSRKISGQAARILIHAHVTEKASDSAEIQNRYVFKVAKFANKIEIARAIEGYYGVKVVSVNTVNMPEKSKRRGKGIAVQPSYRKAIVKIKKGQTIEIMPK